MLDAPVSLTAARPRSVLIEQLGNCRQFPAVLEAAHHDDSLSWLYHQPEPFKVAWGDRGDDQLTAGSGIAAHVSGGTSESATELIDRCRQHLTHLDTLRFFGGFAFRPDDADHDSAWLAFGRASFWLPRVTFDSSMLRLVVLNEADVPVARQAIDRLQFRSPQSSRTDLGTDSKPTWLHRVDLPDRPSWNQAIADAMRLFQDEVLEKIVLARRVDFQLDTPLDPITFFAKLLPKTPACYHFCLQVSPEQAFVGASPERLFRRESRELLSEVVAGTRPRGNTPTEDAALGEELLASVKDQLEHDIVRKSIRQRLHGCVERLDVDAKASLLKLANKQHLFSQVAGSLLPHVSDGMLIDRLHPTPAVGGYPTDNALREIDRLEPFVRGWYAAPVGWVGKDSAEFSVAIRSGLIQRHTLSLYSGAGIVPGSTADSEWNEIEHKISDFLQLIRPATDAHRTELRT